MPPMAAYETADDPRDQVDIRATLHPDTHLVDGTLTWRLTNRSDAPLRELWWHLYLNAFQPGSVFLREGGTRIRGLSLRVEGGIEVRSMTLADGHDLLAASTLDVGVPGDRTQMRTPLPSPLRPQGTLEIRVEFQSRLPSAVARSGFAGDFHVVSQWFPKLAKRRADGSWAHFPYQGLGEFFADFADYTLEVSAPAEWEVFGGGRSLGATFDSASSPEGPAGLRRWHRFAAPAVHDVVFVAAPSLSSLEADVTHARSRTRVRVVYPPGYAAAAQEHLRVVRAGLMHYSQLFTAYPYPELTVVLPTAAALGVSGMEYPTLFVSTGGWRPLPGLRVLGSATETSAHELAHQWFQGLLASDEVSYPLLDEGLTSWATRDLLRHLYGSSRSGVSMLGLDLDGFEVDRSWGLPHTAERAPLAPVTRFEPSTYFRTIYVYMPMLLETISRTWGRERLLRVLAAYTQAQRFAHPDPDDLRDAFRGEYGDWFVRDVLDPALTRGCRARPEVLELESECDAGVCQDVVIAVREGCLALPLAVEIETSRGIERLLWPASRRRFRHRVSAGAVLRVQVDPDRHNLTDSYRTDDVRFFRAASDSSSASGTGARSYIPAPERSVHSRLLAAFQLLLSLVSP